MAVKLTGKIKHSRRNTAPRKAIKIPHPGLATGPIRKNKPVIDAKVADAIGLSSEDVQLIGKDPSILSKLKNAIKSLIDKNQEAEAESGDDGEISQEEADSEDEEDEPEGYSSYVQVADIDSQGNQVNTFIEQTNVKPLELTLGSLAVVSKQGSTDNQQVVRRSPGRPGRPAKNVAVKPQQEVKDPSKDKVFEPLE